MRKVLPTIVALFLSVTLVTIANPAQAGAESGMLRTKVVVDTDCDHRAPRVQYSLVKDARRVGFGYPDSDTIFWFKTPEGVKAGDRRFTLAEQPFGSTRQWVPVVKYRGQDHLTVGNTLSFTRHQRSACVVKRTVGLETQDATVNQRCPRGSATVFQVILRVDQGIAGYVVRPGKATLVQTNGKVLTSTSGYIFPEADRKVEYYLYSGPRAQLTNNPTTNIIRGIVNSSVNVSQYADIKRHCVTNEPA